MEIEIRKSLEMSKVLENITEQIKAWNEINHN